MKAAVRRVHQNLGHPPIRDLVRILRNGGSSEQAIAFALELECDVCKQNIRPKIAKNFNANRVLEFNQRLGIDVKQVPCWRPGRKRKMCNIVDLRL